MGGLHVAMIRSSVFSPVVIIWCFFLLSQNDSVNAFILPLQSSSRGTNPASRTRSRSKNIGFQHPDGCHTSNRGHSPTQLDLFSQTPSAQDSKSKARLSFFDEDNPLQLPVEIQTAGDGGEDGAVRLEQAATDQHVASIVEINLREYGSGPAVFPWDNPRLWMPYLDRQTLALLIELSTRSKFRFEGRDHLTLIVTTASSSRVVGMIEISRQPPIQDRNPPPFPIPLKQLLFTGNLQGWITNLLVVPEYRGRGLGKILVAAAESIARDEWQCASVHLHCEANDRLARRLYRNLGYVSGKPQHLEGTQLVYMSKELSS